MTLAVAGDLRTGFEAFMYSVCILVSVFFDGRSALKEVSSIYSAANTLSLLFLKYSASSR